MGFATALALLLIAFKLLGVITWPWIWVLLPLWIGAAIGALFLVFAMMFAIVRKR